MTDHSPLRKEMIEKRKSLSVEERLLKSDAIMSKLIALPEYIAADTVLVYADYNGEVATDRIILKALLDGKKVYTPVCEKGFVLDFYRVFALDELTPGAYGIREPLKIEYLKLDKEHISHDTLCITPGVVFDREGHRLGYGKGFYDRFFANTDIKNRIGLCFDFQIVDEIVPNSTDIAMTKVIDG